MNKDKLFAACTVHKSNIDSKDALFIPLSKLETDKGNSLVSTLPNEVKYNTFFYSTNNTILQVEAKCIGFDIKSYIQLKEGWNYVEQKAIINPGHTPLVQYTVQEMPTEALVWTPMNRSDAVQPLSTQPDFLTTWKR